MFANVLVGICFVNFHKYRALSAGIINVQEKNVIHLRNTEVLFFSLCPVEVTDILKFRICNSSLKLSH